MTTKTKKVAVTTTVYIACDGKEFDDRDDCVNYEFQLKEKQLLFFDSKLFPSNLDNCTYIYIRTEAELEILQELCDFSDISCVGLIDGPGVYMYEDRRDKWLNISKTIDKIKEHTNDQT